MLPDEEVRRRFLRLAPPYLRAALAVLSGSLLLGAGASALAGNLFAVSLGFVVGMVVAVVLLILPSLRAHRRDE